MPRRAFVLRRSPRMVEHLRQHRLRYRRDARASPVHIHLARPRLKIHPIRELLLLRLLPAGQHALTPGYVHRDGLGHVHVLAGIRRTKPVPHGSRWSLDDHCIHCRLRQLTSRIWPVVGTRCPDFEGGRGPIEMVLHHIRQRDDARPGVLRKERSDPVAASAAANQSHFNVGIRLRPEYRGRLQDEDPGSGSLQETAARTFVLRHAYLLLARITPSECATVRERSSSEMVAA
jgi:hypothetical protein